MGEGGVRPPGSSAAPPATPGCRAEILGIGAASATVALNAWPDEPRPLVRAMRLALEDAGLTPADVDVVYASANARRCWTTSRRAALRELFGERARS